MGTTDLRERGERVGLTPSRAHDVLGTDTVHQQSIGYKGTMTPPRHGFGAHQSDLTLLCQVNQLFQRIDKARCLHVVGKSTEGSITPADVWRSPARVSQP